ncbi:UNC93-like protein MFSD11 [Daphnia pulex]|uniref:UNC93-like protein MFSD11 n=1 Tax=Daphnia pulex TaxID=6669 RepID=UPI001EE0CFDC|nr:UNC93-like protein MFSD11 [Daphnia pulex]XP_046439313.1 UNC93-like protein MFSD11 [Daphnia pulex]
MEIDRKFVNVLILGVAFMLIFTAFQTMGNIQQTVIKSITQEDPSFIADGFTSLAIIYAVLSISNWISPSIISVIGPKWSMIVGGFFYSLYIGSFFLQQSWALYTCSALLGFGAALIWTGQGNYLTLNSDGSNISRNSGVFWAVFQCSFLFGNLFVFFLFQGREQIDQHTRTILYGVLLVVGFLGLVMLVILPAVKDSDASRNTPKSEDGVVSTRGAQAPQGPLDAFLRSIKLFFTKDMGLLSVAFFYIGIEYSFLSGVYSPSIGFTLEFEDSKRLVGLSGIFIGVGEIAGGALFGILGSKTVRYGRDPIILTGFLTQALGFFLIFLNIPNNAPFGDTTDTGFITSSPFVAIFSSFLVAFGDACFNTQVYSILGGIYPNDSAPAFALFKFVSSMASAASFFYSPYIGIHPQLIIIGILLLAGTVCFWLVEWRSVYKRAHLIETSNPDSAMDKDFD